MSYTEIYKFKRDGDAELLAETKNAWRGAMKVWDTLDQRHLPEFQPRWARGIQQEPGHRYHRTSDQEAIKEVWALFDSGKLTEAERIVLGSTFDNVVVMREDIPRLVAAFRAFGDNTSLPEQADLIEQALRDDEDLSAIAWNQTSVNGGAWESERTGTVDGEEQHLPYNILKDDKHWSLFDDIDKKEEPETTKEQS